MEGKACQLSTFAYPAMAKTPLAASAEGLARGSTDPPPPRRERLLPLRELHPPPHTVTLEVDPPDKAERYRQAHVEAERDRVAATAPSRIRGNAVHQSATAKSRNEDQQHLDKSDICSESVNSCAEAWSCNSTSHLRAALPADRPHEGRGGRARMGSCDHGRNRPVVRVPRRAEPMLRA